MTCDKENRNIERVPFNENCAADRIPKNAELPDGRKAVRVPVAKTMADYLWDGHLLEMYRYVDKLRRDGSLDRITGVRVLNRRFNHETLHLSKRVNCRKVDRYSFWADVPVTLDLATAYGTRHWTGYICFWCEFGDDIICEAVDLEKNPERDGYDILNKFLVPVYSNKQVDYLTQKMWKDYGIPEGLTDPKARNPFLLLHKMGYRIFYCRFHDRRRVSSVFFFGGGDLEVNSDVWEVDENGNKKRVKLFDRTPFHVPADSVLVNENIVRFKYLKMWLYHEGIHGQWHYLYYRLQRLTNNDPTNLETKLVPQEEYKAADDPLYFMEKQAKRGQFGLDMPRDATLRLIEKGEKRIRDYKNGGDRYEKIGADIMHAYGEPDFFVRTRMIQLGRVQAYGSYNRADRQRIEPYGFSDDAFFDYRNQLDDDEVITYKIEEYEVRRICGEQEDFRKLMESGKYVYVTGHVVLNEERFVKREKGKWILTDQALRTIDECCLRFVQVFVQKYPGMYVYDRMYHDSEYYKQTSLYIDAFLDDLEKNPKRHPDVEKGKIHDDLDAREYYNRDYPKDFYEGIKQLIRFNGISLSKMAEDFNMNEDTLKRWLQNSRDYKDNDFLTQICLYFKLPDWHSRLVFKRAGVQLDGDIKRDSIIREILRGQSCDGIEAANETLAKYGEKKLGAAV